MVSSQSIRLRNRVRSLCRRGTVLVLFGTVWLPALFIANPTGAAESSKMDGESQPELPTKSRKTSGYLSLGLGGSNVGLTARGLFTLARGSSFVALDAGYATELNFFSGAYPSLDQKDIGVLVGLHCRGSYYVGAVGLGLGYVHSVNRGAFLKTEDGWSGTHSVYERIDRAGIGVPFAAQGTLYWGRVGLGTMLFGNVNATLPSFGAAGTLNVGAF
ncbi:MAG TPA: hypothetical protein VIV60_04040 [Polyangiaceae bacterium]